MTSILDRFERPAAVGTGTWGPGRVRLARRTADWSRRHVVGLVALGALVVRVSYLHIALGADEAGFLMVGGQWQRGGDALYGNYWVDRPPLLITVFRLADEIGGAVPLRLIGALAAVLTVLGVARVAGHLSSPQRHARAAAWAALAAAAWCVTPLTGAPEVNGELLAGPFVAWGVLAVLRAADAGRAADRARCWTYAALAGGAAVAAVLVKQNFVDVGVFACVLLVSMRLRGELSTGAGVRLGLGFLAGALAGLAAVAGWTVLHGTSLHGVWDAMYPFRLRADRVMAAAPHLARSHRAGHLLGLWQQSGLAPVVVLAVVALVCRRLGSSADWALLAVACFAGASVAMGGSYWSHYLLQLVVPVAILAGRLAGSSRGFADVARPLLVAVALVCLLTAVTGPSAADADSARRTGLAIGGVARPKDTILTLYGHAGLDQASGLSSPYRYLWWLPVRTLDPRLTGLDAVLRGPTAPTWVVAWGQLHSWDAPRAGTRQTILDDYRLDAVLDGHPVYLRDGVDRPTPTLATEPTRGARA